MITELELVVRLFLAIGLGALVGMEREFDDEPAGLRTHMLVCLGAALFMIVSIYLVGITNVSDVSRIAAGVVTGIGFLGAGAIFRSHDHIKGLTTAADLWVIAAVGVAVGVGYYLAAIVAAVLVFSILFIKKVFKKKI